MRIPFKLIGLSLLLGLWSCSSSHSFLAKQVQSSNNSNDNQQQQPPGNNNPPPGGSGPTTPMALECTDWQNQNPAWLWCDDFEDDGQLEANYFEVHRANGDLHITDEEARLGSGSLKSQFRQGRDQNGFLIRTFGVNPVNSQSHSSQHFQEIYWRFYLKMESTWRGNAVKLTRATSLTTPRRAQAMISHLWGDAGLGLLGDPATGVVGSQVVTTRYNDFSNLDWLGWVQGRTQIYANNQVGQWVCIEARTRLNTLGQADGIFEFWINDVLENTDSTLNWRGSYNGHGINAVYMENYWNDGSDYTQARYFDNFVISTERIGCL